MTTPTGLAAAQKRDVYYGYDLRNAQLFARFDSSTGEGVTNVYDGFGRLASSMTNMAKGDSHSDCPLFIQAINNDNYNCFAMPICGGL